MKKIHGVLMMAALALALPLQGMAAETMTKKAAGGEKKKTADSATDAAPEKSGPRALPFQGKVASVDAAAKTFTTKTKAGKMNSFTVTEATKITRDEAPAKLEDLKEGDAVRGTRLKKGEGQWEALKVMIGDKPAAAAKKTKEKPAEMQQ